MTSLDSPQHRISSPSLLDQVGFAQHEAGVEEHEPVAADELERVERDGLVRRVAETLRHSPEDLVALAFLRVKERSRVTKTVIQCNDL